MLGWWLALTLWVYGLGFLAIASGALGEEPELGGRFTVPALVLGISMMIGALGVTLRGRALRSHLSSADPQGPGGGRPGALVSARDGLLVFAVLAAVQFPVRALLYHWRLVPMLDLGNMVIAAPPAAIGEAARAPKAVSGIICLFGFVLAYGVAGSILGATLSPLVRWRWGRPCLIGAVFLAFAVIQAIFMICFPFEVMWV